MTRLNSFARNELRWAGLGPTAWARLHGCASAGDWRGDACGCPDDRCIGYHHELDDDCQCLPALIEDHRKQEAASATGREVWAAHCRAIETGAPEDRAEADALAAAWMKDYYPGAVSYSLTESERGITYRNQCNDITWLIFDADKGHVVSEALDWNRTEEHA